MKVWLLYSHHYNFCDQFDNLIGIFDSEDKAVLAQIEEEEDPKYGRCFRGEQTDFTTIEEWEVK